MTHHHVVRDIHRSKGWASQWLKRYKENGIEGLKDKLKGGRHPKVSRQVEYRIKTILKESNQGWSTKQVEDMILQESGIRYTIIIFTVSLENGVLNRKYRGRFT